jgi:hypothetical protein
MEKRRSGMWSIVGWLAASAVQAQAADVPSAPLAVTQAGVTGDPVAPQIDTQSDALFIKLDKNHDGYLSETEASGELADFGAADSNGDRRVDPNEFEAAKGAHSAPEGDEVEPDQAAS